MNIGIRIKQLRKANNLNQTELAEKLNLSASVISYIEAGKSTPTIEAATKMAEIFNVSLDYLVTGKEGTSEINEEEREVLEIMRRDMDFSEAVKKAASFKKKAINFLVSYQPQQAHAA